MNRLKRPVESAGITDVGRKRKSNQDVVYLNDALGLYIVADGMGGHQGGEVASQMVVDTMKARFQAADAATEDRASSGLQENHNLSREANRLVHSIHCANAAVFAKASQEAHLRGMGSTVAAVCLTRETVIAANVGDSPVFLIRDDAIAPLSVTHSLAAARQGGSPLFTGASHILTRSVGVAGTVDVDSCEMNYFRNDGIVLCSDGLTTLVSIEDIQRIVQSEPPASACRMLVDLANARGGNDNISVIVIRIGQGRRAGTGKLSIVAGFMKRLGLKKFM